MRLFSVFAVLALAASACGGAIDESATGTGRSNASAGPGDDPAGAAAETPSTGPRPACALATPIREGFDEGFPTTWGAANLGNLRLDESQPISGKASVSLRSSSASPHNPPRAYFTTQVPNACAATLKLTIRAEAPLLAPGARTTIARLVLPPFALAVVLAEGGAIEVVETDMTTQDSSGVSHAIGTIAPSTPSSIALAFDLEAGKLSGVVSPLGGPPGPSTSIELTKAKGSVVALLVGLWATTAPPGTYWLDDVALE